MARTSTYLNFPNYTEEAFKFYQSIFGGEFIGGINRFSQIPTMELQDVFWGSYFGSLTDKFGINWMVNTNAK